MGLTTVSNVSNIEKKAEELESYVYFLEERVSLLELKLHQLMNPKEVLELKDSSWDNIKQKRNYLLSSTDWVMTPGSTLDQAQWAAYRQQLRDLPQTYASAKLEDIQWPTQPSFNSVR